MAIVSIRNSFFIGVPEDTAIDCALNRKVQGGRFSDTLGFPSCGHAHRIDLNFPGYKLSAQGLINWRVPQGIKTLYPEGIIKWAILPSFEGKQKLFYRDLA